MGLTMISIIAIVLTMFLLIPVVLHWVKERGSPAENRSNGRPKRLAGSPGPLSEADRREMLDGVRNLARSNPAGTAGLLRKWMREDRK